MHPIVEFLRKVGTFYLATADGNQPRVRPFGAVSEFEGRIYIQIGNQKAVFAQLGQSAGRDFWHGRGALDSVEWCDLAGSTERSKSGYAGAKPCLAGHV